MCTNKSGMRGVVDIGKISSYGVETGDIVFYRRRRLRGTVSGG